MTDSHGPDDPQDPHGPEGPDEPDRPGDRNDPAGPADVPRGAHESGSYEDGSAYGNGSAYGGGYDGSGPYDGSAPYDGPHDGGARREVGGSTRPVPPGRPLPRVPLPRGAAEDRPLGPAPVPPVTPVPSYDHSTLKSLLGAWALAACSPEETTAVEAHLTDCALCADEALRLRDAVELLRPEDPLDLDPLLRARVLENCLGRRPARVPVPEWAGPYDAETARLDALLRDLGSGDWNASVRLEWHDGSCDVTVAEVIGHLTAVDGLIAAALGMSEPLGTGAQDPIDPAERTKAYWHRFGDRSPAEVHDTWREQGHALLRTVSFAGRAAGGLDVPYGPARLPLRDALVDRAMECWIHAGDIAEAVAYPYGPPAPRHLHRMIDLAARTLPGVLAGRRRAGLAVSPTRLVAAGAPGRSLHLEVEGAGGGDWYIPLDSPAAVGTAAGSVAHVALDGVEFCQLTAGHRSPQDLAAGQEGDRAVISDVLAAAAGMSRM
ncbi:maleylpyruvate isomerase family mycothiol-dependent enzyme [Streptomyces sp. PTM05]|uniref:Maleylpyruvate isomerase family mycothiol-dependent enzyme n=1 Tax=Streptantibioticus parmotrematis TaxID=2873249 RepID=A0ABS7QNX1_9ACTN|nr:maleylpyruvate isomerase family mycothiol-dependent enzyme [Streptantibioticus parmotrematis]MBY8884878.1 maleylpyruvate isomerase family mycothiol-dependent enzyme [Streptantibioticus parmotrematis]